MGQLTQARYLIMIFVNKDMGNRSFQAGLPDVWKICSLHFSFLVFRVYPDAIVGIVLWSAHEQYSSSS